MRRVKVTGLERVLANTPPEHREEVRSAVSHLMGQLEAGLRPEAVVAGPECGDCAEATLERSGEFVDDEGRLIHQYKCAGCATIYEMEAPS